MKHLDLFSGIGGFAIAAYMATWETVAFCENDPFCNHLLKYYWPYANFHTDIRETDFRQYAGKIDIITGGFPCQPYSSAGKRMGKDDIRHLWPEMLRAIREVKPRWVVGENVSGIVNWSKGLVFREVCADLEAQGYEVQVYNLPACAVDAPHIRERIWFVAYAAGFGCDGRQDNEGKKEAGRNGVEWCVFADTNEQRGGKGAGRPQSNEFNQVVSTDAGISNGRHVCGSQTDCREVEAEKPINCDACRRGIPANAASLRHYERSPIGDGPDCSEERTGVDNQPKRPCDAWNASNPNRNRQQQPGGNIGEIRGRVDNEVEETASDALGVGSQRSGANRKRQPQSALETVLSWGNDSRSAWENFPTQSPICLRNDGLPSELVRFAVSGRRGRRTLSDYQTRQRHRRESIKGAGNAIVPQVALQIFRAINEFETIFSTQK